MDINYIVKILNDFAWGPWMLVLLVGTGIYLTLNVKFIQVTKFGYIMKNTIGKIFDKNQTKKGEVTPFQAVSTALAATVGTGNIAGVTGAIVVGGPGAVFWMWISAFFGMITKYGEVVLAVKFREKNSENDWVGGPMYYIKNGLGDKFNWLAILFCLLGALAAFGIGNMTQVNTIANSINTFLIEFGYDVNKSGFELFDQFVPISSVVIGCIVSFIIGLVIFGGIKRIGSFAEKLVPFMAIVYVGASLIIILSNLQYIDDAFLLIFKGAFSAQAALGGAFGISLMTIIQKGVGRGVFSNEAGLGSAPMAHAATSEVDPVKQGFYGVFEVFMDTIVICTMTSLVLLCGYYNGVSINWGVSGGSELISATFALVFGKKIGSFIVAVCISLFALSTILSWTLYGSRCFEYMFGLKYVKVYQTLFLIVLIFGSCLKLNLVWDIADTLNGFMAIPNLISILALSKVIFSMTKQYFINEK